MRTNKRPSGYATVGLTVLSWTEGTTAGGTVGGEVGESGGVGGRVVGVIVAGTDVAVGIFVAVAFVVGSKDGETTTAGGGVVAWALGCIARAVGSGVAANWRLNHNPTASSAKPTTISPIKYGNHFR